MCSKIKLLGKEGRKKELLNAGQEYKYDLEVPPKNVYIYKKKSQTPQRRQIKEEE